MVKFLIISKSPSAPVVSLGPCTGAIVSVYVPAGRLMASPPLADALASMTAARRVQLPLGVAHPPTPGKASGSSRKLSTSQLLAVGIRGNSGDASAGVCPSKARSNIALRHTRNGVVI